MNNYARKILSLLAVVAVAMTSCVNDNLTDPLDGEAVKEVPALQEQIASVEASVEDVEALSTALEPLEVTLDGAMEALDAHITFLKESASLEEGSLATLDLQKRIARIIGSAEAGLLSSESYDRNLKRHFSAVETGVKAWLGKSFECYYPVAAADAKVSQAVAAFDQQIRKQQLYVDALASDVEAGFRKDENPEELTALAASVEKNAKEAEELSLTIAAKAEEIETGYVQAITAAVSDPSDFDAAALKQLNASVSLQSVDNSLTGLLSRVAACEEQLADIMERLGVLEETVGSLQELLGQIQSVTFMSEYSAENAIAYYDLGPNTRSDGKMARTPHSALSLNYIVRPAAAAAALTESALWDNQMKVFGYYAGRIEQSAVSMFDFDITGVVADETTGIVTVTVSSSVLDEGFYFKETGAKLALSIATGKTDLTSKFVEVVPKDASSTVYVESLTLSDDYIEVDSELTAQLKAVLTPDNVTDATLIWTTSDASIATVSGEGLVTAKAVGEATITATTKSTDEWGMVLSKNCRVKVMPNIKLEAANYVEVGGTMTINVKSPNYIDKQYIKWSSSNIYYATVDEDGVVTGSNSTYDSGEKAYGKVTITCTIGDFNPTVLTHEMAVVYPQPVGVKIPSIADNVSSVTAKMGGTVDLGGSITPEAAQPYFRIQYVAAGGGDAKVAKVNFNTGAVTTVGPGAVTVIAQVLNPDGCNYYYPAGSDVWRCVTVNVEPYWVETLTLPETFEMNLGQVATLTPVFTSDMSGHDPSYPDLKWTSSNPSIVSVNETTGEMTSHETVGTVTITAETTNEWSVADGVAKKATCSVTVKKPVAAIHVGDYYYLDGTWSTELQSDKTVIGVVFATANAASSDIYLRNDHPTCSNGLVVALNEYSTAYDTGDNAGYEWTRTDMANWLVNNGYSVGVEDKIHGYGNTLGYQKLNEAKISSEGYTLDTELVDVLSQGPSTPDTSSGWYIPSYKEMVLLKEGISAVNATLASAGTQVSTSQYITSSLRDSAFVYSFDMNSGTWYMYMGNLKTNYKCRLVLAF